MVSPTAELVLRWVFLCQPARTRPEVWLDRCQDFTNSQVSPITLNGMALAHDGHMMAPRTDQLVVDSLVPRFFLWAVGRRPFNPLTFPARGQESITELAAAMCLDMECLGLFHPDGFVGIKWINRWFQGLIGSELGRKPNGLITLALLEHRVSHGSKFIHSGG